MNPFLTLLRKNHNYRNTWIGQVVSEIGDHFNNVAVFGLVLAQTHNGMVVTGVMLARAIPAILAGPLAGVLLDRFDRKRMMIASDLLRAVVALGFILTVNRTETWLIYLLSGLLMAASPFFTSGRAAILPSIATKEELHTANSLTQTTQWTTLSIGAFLGGASVTQFGFKIAFVGNSLSFLISALCISRLFLPGRGFRPPRRSVTESEVVRPWHEYVEGLRYMRDRPLILGIGMIAVGWATGGGAAQILFSIFGELVFNRGPAGIGTIWGCAGLGLVIGRRRGLQDRAAAEFCELQADDRGLLHLSRRFVHPVQPDAQFRVGAGLHCGLARRGGRELHIEYDAALASCGGRVPGARVRHHRIDAVERDDGVDDAGGNRQPALGSAHDRRDRGRAELDDRDILGLGARDGQAAGAGARRRGAGGDRSAWRAGGLRQEQRLGRR